MMRPPRVLWKAAESLTGAIEGPGKIGSDQLVPIFDAQFADGMEDADPGVVDKDVQAAQLLDRRTEKACATVRTLRNIGGIDS